MRTERAEPILPSRDLEETRQFYQRLGFEAWWGGKAPWDYEIVSRGNLVMHFFLESEPGPGDERDVVLLACRRCRPAPR